MKTIFTSILILLSITSFKTIQNESHISNNLEKENHMNLENKAIYVTALIYIKQGQETNFETYRARAAAIMEKYNARLEKIIKPTMLAKGDMPLPSEIHFAVFENEESMNNVNNDTEYQKIVKKYREPSIEKLIIIPSKLSGFEFKREIGDKSKTYGIALLNYNKGQKYVDLFEKYHNEACKIIPEFGTHFERFLIPIGIKGDFKKPDEIHRFYFDSVEGLQQMGKDPRMQNLFPLRDESLSTLNFIIGESI